MPGKRPEREWGKECPVKSSFTRQKLRAGERRRNRGNLRGTGRKKNLKSTEQEKSMLKKNDYPRYINIAVRGG